MTSIAIVEDKSFLRQSLIEQLTATGEIDVVIAAKNGKDFLQQMEEIAEKPPLVLMDIEMPTMDGIQAVDIGKVTYPETYFIMLTVVDNDDKVFEAIMAGASGYLLKEESPQRILGAIKDTLENRGSALSPSIARKVLRFMREAPPAPPASPQKAYGLSDREVEVLELLVHGLTYTQTAEKLHISPYTVRTHIGNIYQKLHVRSKAAVIKIANKQRWFF